MNERFCIGQAVKWTSQANGGVKTKSGIVVDVLPPKMRPEESERRLIERHGARSTIDSRSCSRMHESYVVMVKGATARAKPVLYWPLVSALRKA